MTKPSDQNQPGDRPLDVDGVIHHAREASWRLPEEPADKGPAAPATASGGAGHAPAASHSGDGTGASHAAADHGPSDHGAGHGGGHSDEEALGPVDTQMWGAGIVATAIGLIVIAGFVLATSGSGAY